MSSPSLKLLELKNLKVHFPITRGVFKKVIGQVKAVDDISFSTFEGETLALVGESGCGKSTMGRCIIGINKPTEGKINYYEKNGDYVDLGTKDKKQLKPFRQAIRMIFQDPYSSLNPRMKVLQIVGEPLVRNNIASGSELEDRVLDLLKKVGLRPEYIHRYPHAFSGGERQRIGIARALALNPRLIIADEAVSALDVSVQAQILNLMQDLQAEFNLTYLFITHDLSVVEYLSDRVAVMYVGKIVEIGTKKQIFNNPKHPYTAALLSAVPKPNPRLKNSENRILLKGEVADPSNPPSGCYFHPRCPYSQEKCKTDEPKLLELGNGQIVSCHFSEELELNGVEIMTQQA